MFKGIFDFSTRRSALQALGWYIVWFVLCVLLICIAGGVYLLFSPSAPDPYAFARAGVRIGRIGATVLVTGLGLMLLAKRGLTLASVALFFAAVLLSLPLGALGGLIPLAALTTRPSIQVTA